MNHTVTSSRTSLPRPPRKGIWMVPLIAAVALTWSPTASFAGVIDDFDDGPGWDGVVNPEGGLVVAFEEGQLHLTKVKSDYGCLYYARAFPMPEDRAVKYQLDVVRQDNPNEYVGIFVSSFLRPERGYGLFWMPSRAGMEKYWENDGYIGYAWETVTRPPLPVTLTLALRTEGDAVHVEGRVVARDDPSDVIFSRRVIDSAAVDPSRQEWGGGRDLGPAAPGCSYWVILGFGALSGSCDAVIDNFVCSEDEVPARLHIGAESGSQLALEWYGNRVPLEADSLLGPWRPCGGLISMVDNEPRQVLTSPSGSSRFFKLSRGAHSCVADGHGDTPTFRAASLSATTAVPSVSNSRERVRVRGLYEFNSDFILDQTGGGCSLFESTLASLDIVDWDSAMRDAGIGILVRVVTDRGLYYPGEPIPQQYYSGLLTLKTSVDPTQSRLSLTTPEGGASDFQTFHALDPSRDYRLQFLAVGSELTLQVADLEHLETPLATCRVVDGRLPRGMVLFHGTRSSTDTYDVSLRRIVTSGTLREP